MVEGEPMSKRKNKRFKYCSRCQGRRRVYVHGAWKRCRDCGWN
jgi:hypothetical protein